MLLAIDIGNTSIMFGVFKDRNLLKKWNIQTERDNTCDEYIIKLSSLFSHSQLEISEINAVIISSVVPPLIPVFQELSKNLFKFKPFVVGPGLKTGMPILYENPLEVGADRVVASVAAFEKYGGPVIIVDFGTAATFDVVSSQGEYLGGAISPGIQIAAEALYLKTAKLPHIEIKKPDKAIGKTTVESMQSGLYFGYLGLLKNIISEIKKELDGDPCVISTGGFASQISQRMDYINHYEPFLVLEGLRIIYEKNKN